MNDVDYKSWTDYIEDIFKINGLKPSLVLDLGCGTGSFCIEMSKRRYEMIGVDQSVDMLACAKFKSDREGLDILYINQDMSDFELYGTVDAVVCLMDSVNYLTAKNDVKRMFKLVENYLNPGGLFIFDINTAYKLEYILGDNIFHHIGDDITYIWQNSYDRKKRLCEFDLTFFIREKDKYLKHTEIHYERAYTIVEMKQMIEYSGLEFLCTYDELRLVRPKIKSERVFFVCKKRC